MRATTSYSSVRNARCIRYEREGRHPPTLAGAAGGSRGELGPHLPAGGEMTAPDALAQLLDKLAPLMQQLERGTFETVYVAELKVPGLRRAYDEARAVVSP